MNIVVYSYFIDSIFVFDYFHGFYDDNENIKNVNDDDNIKYFNINIALTFVLTGRLHLSDRAHIVFDFHQAIDGLNEAKLGDKKLGK